METFSDKLMTVQVCNLWSFSLFYKNNRKWNVNPEYFIISAKFFAGVFSSNKVNPFQHAVYS